MYKLIGFDVRETFDVRECVEDLIYLLKIKIFYNI